MTVVAAGNAAVIFSLIAMVIGYVVIAALFYGMVYKPRKREKAEERKRDEER